MDSFLSSCLIFLLLVLSLINEAITHNVLHSFTGTVGAGNYTYYRLSRKGDLTIYLESLEGDADLYISDKTEEPTYLNYEYQSTTCGEDSITISPSFPRPVNIGVYGHIHKVISKYRLVILGEKLDNYVEKSPGKNEEEESVIWTIFVGILKILVDILL